MELENLFKEIEIFLDWERDRPNYKQRVRRVRKDLGLQNEELDEGKTEEDKIV